MTLRFPRGFVARLGLVLIAALAIEYAGNLILDKWQARALVSSERTGRIAERLATAAQLASHAEPAERPRLMADLTLQGMTLNWVPATIITDSSPFHPQLQQIRADLERAAPGLTDNDLRLTIISSAGGRRDLLGAMRIAQDGFITFRVRPFLESPPPFAVVAGLHVLLLAAVAGAALIMMRALVRPLRDLADIADATGRGHRPDIRIEGPWEVRRVATAFRAMQQRLTSVMEDQTKALIAVSHDLRTPIQRMRLRAALLLDGEARAGFQADLADLERFTKAVLDFIADGSHEERRVVDLAAMVMTLVDNLSDAGANIEYHGPDTLPVLTRPSTLKRALANLADNAVAHADHVRITLLQGETIRLSIDDDGPGIRADQREEALLPFRRLVTAPSRVGPGSGLGLAIAKNAVTACHGHLALDDSPLGGLAAVIHIPAASATLTSGGAA